ncbi:MAG: hypothetical protein AAGM22_28920 [Acidobacteriota bacterium]
MLRRDSLLLPIALLAGLTSSAALDAQSSTTLFKLAAGDEFQVNTSTTDLQRDPAISRRDEGYVVVWASESSSGTDNDLDSIQAQLLDSDGLAVGSEFQVNTSTTGSQQAPEVASWPDGRFVVVWDSSLSPRGQVFDATGTAVGAEIEIDASLPVVSLTVETLDSGFLVASSEFDAASGGFNLIGRRFDSNGAVIGSEFAISATEDIDVGAALHPMPDGSILAVWSQTEQGIIGEGDSSVQMRRLGADGTPLGSAVQVNSYTTGTVGRVKASVAPDGSFVVAWANEGSPEDDSDGDAVLARRFDEAASPLGDDFQVNSYTTGSQDLFAVHHLPGRAFLVVWGEEIDPILDQNGFGIVASRFDASGDPEGEDFVIPQTTAGDQMRADLAVDAAGNLLATWDASTSTGTDDSGLSIQARRFMAEADAQVSLSNQMSSVTPGELVAYDLEVFNGGPETATGASLEHLPPAALDCIWIADGTSGTGGFSSSGEGGITESLTVPSGGSVTYFLACLVDPAATGLLESTASILSQDQGGNDVQNDSATDSDVLTPVTDLALRAQAPPFAPLGSAFELVATVSNDGPSQATGGSVDLTLPAELTLADGSACTGSDPVSCPLAALAPGDSVTLTVPLNASSSAPEGTRVFIDLAAQAADTDPDLENDLARVSLLLGTPLFFDGFESGDLGAWSETVP